MDDILTISTLWPKEKQDEVYAVKKFLDNQKITFELSLPNIEPNPPEPTDIWVKDINKKFQIVVADFTQHEMVGRTKPDSRGIKIVEMPPRKKEDVWREYVINPLKKKNKYGQSANGITLLINAPFDPPWIEQDIATLRKSGHNHVLKELGFDEIYIVCRYRNIPLYP